MDLHLAIFRLKRHSPLQRFRAPRTFSPLSPVERIPHTLRPCGRSCHPSRILPSSRHTRGRCPVTLRLPSLQEHSQSHSVPSALPPVLKWPGGKRLLLRHLHPHVPAVFEHYFEPFLGSAALFFSLQPKLAHLSDINPELINFYVQLKNRCESLLAELQGYSNDADTYYNLRDTDPPGDLRRAARFFYLTRTSFNGIYRTNRNGRFNVPFANNGRSIVSDVKLFRTASNSLKETELRCCDFTLSCLSAKSGDFVYFDPPYTVAHGQNGFLRYNRTLFTWKDQLRLHALVEALTRRGVYVMLSNAMHSSLQSLYSGFPQYVILRHSIVSADPSARRPVQELLITNYDPQVKG